VVSIVLRRKKKYQPDDAPEQTFTAFIVKGNRQVVKREVIASKRFRVDAETYLIRPECIFMKVIDGHLTSVSYYREGNPNPYDFKQENIGIKATELDRIFAEDFYHIVTDLQPEQRGFYIMALAFINLIIFIITDLYIGFLIFLG
jgi:hypothetical protein